ncbi:hypothetical protein B0H14DRAFT_2895079 [Mycena olivaceomarginata]|nr:hypothetical protein B0H14DRAFT_2895079 [Mycena olivaceomarginata]
MILTPDLLSEKIECVEVLPPSRVEGSAQSSTSPGSHRCAHCNSEGGATNDRQSQRVYGVRALIISAPCLVFAIFILAIAEVSMEHALLWAIQQTGLLQIVVAYYALGTFLTLIVMLRQEVRREPQEISTRTRPQIYVLCGLAFTWLGFTCGLVMSSSEACMCATCSGLGLAMCTLFALVDAFAGILFITLFATAIALYRRSLILNVLDAKSSSMGHRPVTSSGT